MFVLPLRLAKRAASTKKRDAVIAGLCLQINDPAFHKSRAAMERVRPPEKATGRKMTEAKRAVAFKKKKKSCARHGTR